MIELSLMHRGESFLKRKENFTPTHTGKTKQQIFLKKFIQNRKENTKRRLFTERALPFHPHI